MNSRLFLILATVVIAVAVIPWGDFQGHTHWDKVGWIPFVSWPVRARDIVANMLLFAPFGSAVAVTTRTPRGVAVATIGAASLSFLGEAAQLFSHTRFPSATDVASNTMGAALAAILVSRVFAIREIPPGPLPHQ